MLQTILDNQYAVFLNSGFFLYILFMLILLFFTRKIDFKRRLLILLFAVYTFKIIDLTFFPLPLNPIALLDIKVNFPIDNPYLQPINLVPFSNITALKDLKEPLLNILMMAPFGIFLPAISNRFNFKRTTIASFIFSATIECLQLLLSLSTGAIIRYFDVTDIITNTLGGMVGYSLFIIVVQRLFRFTDRHELFKRRIVVLCLSFISAFVFIASFANVFADDYDYNLKQRGLRTSGKDFGRFQSFEAGTVTLSGTFDSQKRTELSEVTATTPTISLFEKYLVFDISYGKIPTCQLILEPGQESGNSCDFSVSWKTRHASSRYYFVTETNNSRFVKIGRGRIEFIPKP
ncbi:hypothetical protein G7062_06005 [Erysipelothrix sp. HDW6C]|uniref:VanZ family protein n=1 Tax=Erysipelothrix sp. HDW6C TaxID=2714930 RepID=UPI00140E60BE|nr:VanZ family protein [Erysipelothrix sp. HDW6C]QIK69871.1 hypothetical protein G7062_06005 [Erysipelothrix sp. HDW6C]